MNWMTIFLAGTLTILSVPEKSENAVPISERNEGNEMTAISNRALALRTEEIGGMAEIAVIAKSNDIMNVTYKLNVFGENTTRHSASTKIYPDTEMLLSKVRISAEKHWCARLEVKQDNGLTYQVESGEC